MFANILWAANLPESEQLSWDTTRLIIQSQSNLAMYGIMVIIGVAALVAGASWFTNFYLVRYELKKTIESFNSEIIEIEKNLKDEVEKMEKKVVKAVENLSEAMIIFNAEKARLFAITNKQMGLWKNVVVWWGYAIQGYAKAGLTNLLRVCIDGLNEDLEQCEKLKDDSKKEIRESLSFIPEILQKEKEQIEDKLDKLPLEE